MSEHVIALDPGQRTGWASAWMDTDRLELEATGVLPQLQMAEELAATQYIQQTHEPSSGQPLTWRPGHGGLSGVFKPFDTVVAESWIPREQNGSMAWIKGDRLLSAQHVGQIRLIAHLSGAKYTELAPSDKPAWVSSMPRAWANLDDRSNEQHDKDARMHLWGYFFREWFTGSKSPDIIVP